MIKKEKNLDYRLILLFTFLLGILTISFINNFNKNIKLTGFIVNSEGNECDGNWTLNETTSCINGTQNLVWISLDTTNCTSPIIKTQSCVNEICVENWSCSEWNSCLDGQQTRICNDLNSCGTTTLKPNETQSCVNEICVENWSCSEWNSCLDGQQTRICNDLNSCGTTTLKPNETQSCEEEQNNEESGSEEENENLLEENEENGTIQENILQTQALEEPEEEVNQENEEDRRIEKSESCTPNWKCGDWQECINKKQIRICIDQNKCNIDQNKPETQKDCIIKETCYDKIKNQNETGIDCGGNCKPCGIFTIIGSTVSETIVSGKEFLTEKIFKNKIILIILLIASISVVEALIFLRIKRKKESFTKEQENDSKEEDKKNENKEIEIKKEKQEDIQNNKKLKKSGKNKIKDKKNKK
jgi:hypothetical protein